VKQFIDRDKELLFLKSEYKKKTSSLVILYGRRRTGKTALLSRFLQDVDGLYFLASEESEHINKRNFAAAALEYVEQTADFKCTGQFEKNKQSVEEIGQLCTWDDIFRYILLNKEKPLILIDEFQYLGRENPAFPSIFQRIWDTMLKDSHTMVVLCGSLLTMMKSQTLNYSSPLYGRGTGQLKLGQIPFSCYHGFMPQADYEKQIERYAVTGGIPKYIELFIDEDDIYDAIRHNVLDASRFLYDEPEFLLQNEVEDVGRYFSIIRTIAQGARRLGEIAGRLETSQVKLVSYLDTLIDLDLLEKEVPVTERNPEKSKKVLYRIKDNYIAFWFRFVYPYKGQLEIGKQDYVMRQIRAHFIDSHVSYVYEQVCREKLMHSELNLLQAGRYWDQDVEIDLLGMNADEGRAVFGECKYWSGQVGMNVLKSLETKSRTVRFQTRVREKIFVLFSIHGFTEELIEYASDRENILLMQ